MSGVWNCTCYRTSTFRLTTLSTQEAAAAVRAGVGWTRLDRLSLIRVAGPNRAKFLHSLLSNDIASLTNGRSRLAALMNLKGQQVAWMRVMAESDAFICELPAAVRDAVVDTFIHYKVGAPVRFEKPTTVVFALFGKDAPSALITLGAESVPSQTDTFTTTPVLESPIRISRSADMPADGFTLHVDATVAAEVEARLRLQVGEPIESSILDAFRVEEGLPWHGIDVTSENLLHETGQLVTYHSSSKGCYLGQEVVARLEGRGGNVNKLLRGLKLTGPSAVGDAVSVDGKAVGRLTTVGESADFGAVAMGYVHRAHAEPGTKVSVGGAEAEIALLPFRK